jgi:hypothetical protein
MTGALIIVALLQGIPIAPQAGGTVSGVLKNLQGKPAAGARVSAMTKQEPRQQTAGVALASLAETDEEGRFTIENIPPGQYYIVAGSIDRPTYYPGTQDIDSARTVQITAGARLSGFNFVVIDASRLMSFPGSGSPRFQINLRLQAEPGSRLPVVSPAGTITLEFERTSDRTTASAPATAPSVSLELRPTGTTEYRVRLKNLPEGFDVKSMTYGAADISSGILSLPSTVTVATSASQSLGVFAFVGLGYTIPGDTLTATIGEVPARRSNPGGGVRVTGIGRRSDTHPVFLSGRQGVVFSDGSFEFREVPPGRHTIALIDFPGRALGTTLVVGDQDIDGVFLDEIAALPLDIKSLVVPGPIGNAPQGSKLQPVVLRGVVLDRMTQLPPPSGQVWVSGRNSPSYHLDEAGKFEVQGLLPGTYRIELQVAGYPNMTRELKVGFDDLMLELQIEK